MYDFYGEMPELGELIPLSLQHVLAAVVGVITPAIIISGVCNLTAEEKTMMIQAALILLAAGLIPRLSALLTTIPQSVIGGATLSVFAQIAMTGVRLFTKDGMTPRKTTVVGMSVALGVGITQVAGCLQGPGFPSWVHTVFGTSSVVVATIMAIFLNLVLPKEDLT